VLLIEKTDRSSQLLHAYSVIVKEEAEGAIGLDSRAFDPCSHFLLGVAGRIPGGSFQIKVVCSHRIRPDSREALTR
jgi:hypothetical protein